MQGEVHDPRAYALGGVAGHAGLFSTAPNLAILLGMVAPPFLMFAATFVLESRAVMLNQGVPGVLASCLGPLVGVITAGSLKAKGAQV